LAIVAKERVPGYLDIPTVMELGIPVDMGPWFGFLAPAGVPADVIARLHAAIESAMAEPQNVEAMKKISVVTQRMEQPAYQTFFNNEYDRWGSYIRNAKITLEQ
jgi:tripartite-type tricarboxylate transporter receptor subunit TctC